MRIRVLGCSGGLGGNTQRTTALLIDDDILIDCGTGVGNLSLSELAQIDHVFITHSHLDHLACLPLLIDTVGDMRQKPITVYATEATLESLRNHIFNWAIWPDFTEIPSREKPCLRYASIQPGAMLDLAGRKITPLPANHTVPAVGYQLDSGAASLVFTGDTGPCAPMWQAINRIRNLRYLIIETAFSNREAELARVSLHLCPRTLAEELAQLQRDADIFITHLKPGQSELIMQEIADCVGEPTPRMLQIDQEFVL